MNSTESTERKKPSVWILLLAAVPIGAALVEMSLAKARGTGADGTPDWVEIGARGDWWGGHFGAAAALTSAILFFYAVWLQHSELQETRKEMRQARTVHMAQRNQLERQAIIAEKSAQQVHIFDVLERRQSVYDKFQKFFCPDGSPILPLCRNDIEDLGVVQDYEQTEQKLRNFDIYLDKTISISRLNQTEKDQVRKLADLFPHCIQGRS